MGNQEKIIYPYSQDFKLADTETAVFEVEIISSATTATTSILTPDSRKIPKIIDNGSSPIGTGETLRGKTYVSSILMCPTPSVENIEVNYKINGQLLVAHVNPTSEQDRPRVDIVINFIKP